MLMSARQGEGPAHPAVGLGAWIVAEAAKGLHYAHEKRDEGGAPLEIVHRDVSPQNVLLSFEGVVKIADFGIASARLTDEEEGVLKGKYGYMSPEQARGEKVDRRGDLYALGVIMWECLTGRPLHGGLGGEALLDIVRSGNVEPPSTYVRDIPEELETIVLKLLAPKAEDRYPTGRDVAAAIGRAMLQKQVLRRRRDARDDARLVRPARGLRGARRADSPPEHHTQAAAPHALREGPEDGAAARLTTSDGLAASAGRAQELAAERGRLAQARGARGSSRRDRHASSRRARREAAAPTCTSDEQRRALVRALERSRAMLGDMAYKRGMRWVWTSDLEARAIAGLGPKPAKAASDAAWLAVETHEAIDAIKEDLPAPIGASLSHRPRHRVGHARPRGKPRALRPSRSGDVPRRRPRARHAREGHLRRRRRVSARAPRFSLG